MVIGADEKLQPVVDPHQLDIITIPDDRINCDYCNDDLLTFLCLSSAAPPSARNALKE
jgi:hypothetical protein